MLLEKMKMMQLKNEMEDRKKSSVLKIRSLVEIKKPLKKMQKNLGLISKEVDHLNLKMTGRRKRLKKLRMHRRKNQKMYLRRNLLRTKSKLRKLRKKMIKYGMIVVHKEVEIEEVEETEEEVVEEEEAEATETIEKTKMDLAE